jgi:hypothetical protein
MRTARKLLLASMGVLLVALPALSHHAFTSEFDDTKSVTFTAVITKVDWINPHAYLYLESKDPSGQATTWTMESFPPGVLSRAGLTRDLMKIGDTVTIEAYMAKDGTKTLGWAHRIQFSDGRVINISKEPVAPAPGK